MCIRDRFVPVVPLVPPVPAPAVPVTDGDGVGVPLIVTVGAVSYTHLDVYKRQILSCADFLFHYQPQCTCNAY